MRDLIDLHGALLGGLHLLQLGVEGVAERLNRSSILVPYCVSESTPTKYTNLYYVYVMLSFPMP